MSEPTFQVVEKTLPSPLERLREVGGPWAFLLESSLPTDGLGRFSFVGERPFLIFRSRGDLVTIRTRGEVREVRGDPLEALQALLREYGRPDGTSEIPFTGGAVGYLGYDLNRQIERLPDIARDDLGLPDIHLGFYDCVEAWDHARGRSFVVEATHPRPPVEDTERDPVRADGSGIRFSFTRESYLDAVRTVKRRIREGEIYQANLSQRFDVPTDIAPVDLYARLRAVSPAPFACHLDCGPFCVIGASPERFLRVRGRHVETRPIKGTRRRGSTPEEDERLGRELISAEKDGAELAMIVDVERNDLGRVAEYGSVRVVREKALRTHPTVLHLEATVEARLREGMGPVECIRAAFPGGSITGAPKIRAMEILEGIEPTRRGVYTGAVGYLGFDGRCDLNIAIRTLVLKDGVATFQAGGGIVTDSDPEAEYDESLDKARALLRALGIDGG